MTDLEALQLVLTASHRRTPEKPLTNSHLLNIVKMARRAQAAKAEHVEKILSEALGEDRKWGAD